MNTIGAMNGFRVPKEMKVTTHPLTPHQHTLSHPITPHQHTLSHPINTPSHTPSTHTPYQHTPCHHRALSTMLSTHPITHHINTPLLSPQGPLDTFWKIRDKEGYILNNDGTKSACVHQWDRWFR